MSTFEIYLLIILAFGTFMLGYVARALEIANKHHSNIADRLLDIQLIYKDRR